MPKIIASYKTTIIGIALLIYSLYTYHITDTTNLTFENFESWYIASCGAIGTLLVFSGDKWLNEIVSAIAHRIKGNNKNEE